MKGPRHGHDGDGQGKRSLTHLSHLAQQDAQRPSSIGAGLKVLEALLNVPGFRHSTGGKT